MTPEDRSCIEDAEKDKEYILAALVEWRACLDEIERLKNELVAACEHVQRMCDQRAASRAETEEYRKLAENSINIRRYRDALEWYADDKHWTLPYLEGPHGDYGIRAKGALGL